MVVRVELHLPANTTLPNLVPLALLTVTCTVWQCRKAEAGILVVMSSVHGIMMMLMSYKSCCKCLPVILTQDRFTRS